MTGASLAAQFSRAIVWGCVFGLVSGAALAAPSKADKDDPKAGECLSKPNGAAPAGERWFYRVERGSKRRCWYTHAGASKSATAQRKRPVEPEKETKAREPEPLQLSVANARAEASIAPAAITEPPDAAPIETPRNPAWTLADRWSQNAGDAPTTPLPAPRVQLAERLAPAQVAPQSGPVPPERVLPASSENATDDGLTGMAAAAIALLGLSIVLIAMLVRRRRLADMDDEGSFVQSPPLTDLNDRPLMTWRKGLRDQLHAVRQPGRARNDAKDDDGPLTSTGFEGFPRKRTGPPGARA